MTLGAHRLVAHADDPWPGGFVVVLHQERSAPIFAFSVQQSQKRSALNVRRGRAAAELDHRRGDVQREDHLAHFRARLDALGIADEEGRADALLVRKAPLGAQAMLAEEKAVVAEEHYAGALQLSRLVQGIQDRA